MFSVIRSSNDEQRSVPVGVLVPCLCERVGVELLVGGSGDLAGVHRDGGVCEHPDHFPAVDVSGSIPTVSDLPRACVCSRLRLWVVVDYDASSLFMRHGCTIHTCALVTLQICCRLFFK